MFKKLNTLKARLWVQLESGIYNGTAHKRESSKDNDMGHNKIESVAFDRAKSILQTCDYTYMQKNMFKD